MNILFISQYFYPETFRGNEICFEWARRGDTVTVIAGIPNYPQGHFFKGYGFFKRRREIIKGVSVIRVPVIPRGNNKVQLLLNYLSYALFASVYVLFLALRKRYDLVFVQQLSPVLMSFPAVIYKKLRKVPLYTWVLDLWPESLQAAGGVKNHYILNFFVFFSKLEYKYSDKILMSSKSFSKSILSKGPFSEKLIYFPNWAEDVFSKSKENEVKEIPKLSEGFRIMFAGNVGESQDFDHIMKAASLLKDDVHIHFVIVGDGRKKQWIDSFIEEHQLENTVSTLGRWPIETMPSFFEKADVMLVSLKDEMIFNLTAPAKIQAYMQSKKPIIGMINGEGASLIQEAKCGFTVHAEDSETLASTIKKMSAMDKAELDRLGKNGYEYCMKFFNKEVLMNELYEIIRNKES